MCYQLVMIFLGEKRYSKLPFSVSNVLPVIDDEYLKNVFFFHHKMWILDLTIHLYLTPVGRHM